MVVFAVAKAWRRLHLPSSAAAEAAAPRARDDVPRRRRWPRRLLFCAAMLALLAALVSWGVKHTTWLGPSIADGLRSVMGTEAVERLERFVATARDRSKSLFGGHAKPRSYAQLQQEMPAAAPDAGAVTAPPPELSGPPPSRPKDVGPMHRAVAAPGDGAWRTLPTPTAATEAPLVYTTMLHPDPRRSWSELFVFAMDLRRVRLHAVAGTQEPIGSTPESIAYARTGLIAPGDRGRVIVAMNGGFKAEHGHHGMRVDGVTLLGPREHLCTIAAYRDGSLRIGTWKNLAATEPDMTWWRQAAPCMYEDGKLHPGLLIQRTRNWGAALEGDVAIPRSAIGVDGERTTLYFGLSNDTTPRVIADGLRHAGAADVAQLDVNWPYPRFVVFRPDASGALKAAGVVKGVLFDPDDYIRKPARRDFFYVTYVPAGID